MKSFTLFFAFLFVALSLVSTSAFAPKANVAKAFVTNGRVTSPVTMNLFDEQERQSLTRESEPEDFFST
jgi:hypothetical protein